jgi:hypothetical protein
MERERIETLRARVYGWPSGKPLLSKALTTSLSDKINGSSKLGEAAGYQPAKWQTRLGGLVW